MRGASGAGLSCVDRGGTTRADSPVPYLVKFARSAAWAEGACHSRKVIDTEVLQPLEGAAMEGERPIHVYSEA